VHFFNFDHLRNYTSKFRPHLRYKFCAPSLPLLPLIFSYLQALIHGFLWWWACSWLIFSLKWRLQSPLLLLHSAAIDLQEANDSIDEEDPRLTCSTWSYIKWLGASSTKCWSLNFKLIFSCSIKFVYKKSIYH